MFDAYPTYSRYRPLRLLETRMRGEDVYALQTGLHGVGEDVGPHDGILGSLTDQAIRSFQVEARLVSDGIAGPATQTAVTKTLALGDSRHFVLPDNLLFGQLTFESGCFVGNYSAIRSDGSYDAGVAQRNTAHTPAEIGFDTPISIEALASNTREHYNLFAGVVGRRRWELAAGAWNAPAFACLLAFREGAKGVPKARQARSISDAARATFEAYIDNATAMM
jgi:hypothetical protein